MNMKWVSFYFLLFLSVSCVEKVDYLEDALRLAAGNRTELEKVLLHYQQHPSDSLKYRAAVFLISNMPGHYSYKYPDYLQAYYDELVDSVTLDVDNVSNKRIIEAISAKYDDSRIFETVEDIEAVTGKFLIDNIEQAFSIWEDGEWATHVSFNDFCEYILPYKCNELQFLDNWREYAKDMLKGDIETLHFCDMYKNLAFMAATVVSKEIIALNRQVYPPGGVSSIPIRDVRTLAQMPFGSCDDFNFLATPIMRSKGIPVMEDFTPQWPFQALAHGWNVLLNNDGKNMVFSAGGSNPGEPHKLEEKMAKVFRKCYAINREIEAIQDSEKSVPATFSNCFIKDVTNEYMTTQDVEIEIPTSFSDKYKYAYLAVFDNKNWIPVHYGKVNGKKAQFTAMGRNCMYLPVFYDDNQIVPFSSPFFITSKGTISRYETDITQTTTIFVYRKYFFGRHCYGVGNRMKGGRFEAANKYDFSDAVFIHTIPEFTVQSGMVRTDTIKALYRYWRYYSANGCHNNLAELYFYEPNNEKPVYGKIIGTKGSAYNNPNLAKEAVFDNDPLTFYDALEPSDSWVGMDFGQPVMLDHISYTPRGDGNDVTPTDTHELLYWGGHQWVSLGKRVANDIVLVYENVPANTIYWIRNLSRGRDERIFTYENGKQVWW